jgi:hypothetical protein
VSIGSYTDREIQNSSPEQLEITRLKQELAAEKVISTNLAPLANVGVAVRSRFLELCKRGKGEEDTDPQVIERGDRAVHRGNLTADNALIALKILDPLGYGEIFRGLYNIKSGFSPGLLPQEFEKPVK